MPDPIIQKLPATQTAVENKYRNNPDLFSGAPTPISNALMALDLQRAQRGQNPLSVRQTQLALQAAITGQAQTQPQDKSFFGSLTSDFGTILKSIPRLPAALFREAQQLPELPAALSAATQKGSPIEQISAIAKAPGIRLLPGSFVASNLATPGELLHHPLFTALDILPVKNVPVVKGGIETGLAPVKKAVLPALQHLGATRPGEYLRETFGTQARDVSQMEATATMNMRESAYGEGPVPNDPLAQTVRQAGTLWKRYRDTISEDRRRELTTLMSEDDPAIRTLSGDELAFVNEAREITDRLGHYGIQKGLLQEIDGEIYDLDSASRIMRARRRSAVAQDYGDIRDSITKPEGVDLASKIADVPLKEYLKPGGKIKLIEGYAHALEAQGIDATPIFNQLRQYRNTKSPLKYTDEGFSDWWANTRNSLTPRREVDLDGFVEQLKKHAATDPLAARMLDRIRSGEFQKAQVLAKQANRRKTYVIPDMEDAIYALDQRKRLDRYMGSIKKFDPTTIARRVKSAERIEARLAPARFHPLIERLTQEEVTKAASAKFSDSPDWPQVFQALQERNYSWLGREGLIPKAEIRQIQSDVRSTWKDLKAAGHDPVFVHRISENQLGSIRYPRVLERVPRPTQTVKRSWNITPAVDDISVALTHQGMEWLARRGSEEFIDTVLTKWGRDQASLIDQYIPAARVAAKSPSDVLGVAERMMKREWEPYNPTNIINWPSPRIKRWSDNQVWVPKTVANTIQRMHSPPAGKLSAIVDPIMNVFRTSLLPLSPRWHVYNILGGGMVLTVGAGPSAWAFLKQAREMVSRGEIPEGVPRGIGTIPRETLEWNAKGTIQKPLEAIFHYKGGQTLRRIWDETQKARNTFGTGLEKSYEFNAFFDDMYRTMAYLKGEKSVLKKGMSVAEGQKAGIELARKVFQQWDRMTPIERSIMRFIFPFYGWTSHIMKFALQYPFDHPIRTAIMGSFARNELEDMGTGLPERFLNMFFLGDTDKDGNVKALNLAGMNPFSDVANNFTFQGFLGQANPLITSAFQAAGVDTGNGGPELFPNMQYDSETGRLAFRGRNPLLLLAESILPQSRVLLGFADSSSEFQQLLRQNPEAAGRLLLSQSGIPIIFRNVNLPQEQAKAEIARDEGQSKALNEALKTGNWGFAERFPNLRPMLAQLKQLQESGQLAQYTPESAGQSAIRLAQNALASQFTAIPHP